jgi:hypothetical protein
VASWRVILVAAAVTLAVAVPAARAGTYDVAACDAASGANNSWAAYAGNPLGTTAYTACPTGGDPWRGMIARSVVQQNGGASGNVVAQMKFTSAPGTTIIGLNAAYDFYRGDPQWEAALSTGSVLLKGCPIGGIAGCSFSSAGEWIDVPGGSQVIYIDAYCVTTSCPLDSGDAAHNFVSAYARLASASVRLEDDSAPTINSVGGTLWSDGWKSGTQTLAIDASDNSGIRQTAVLADGQQQTKGDRACDATQVVPCPNGADTFSIGTANLADGQHQITAQAIDSAGNPSSVTRTVLVDNSPPGPPQGLEVDGGQDWRSKNSLDLHWVNPQASGAPTAGINWQICPAAGTQTCVSGSKDGDTVQTLNALTVPKDGDWVMKLWLRDAAGNNTPNNGVAVHLRVDSEAPTAVFSPPDPADPTRAMVQASDATSGIASGSIDYKPHDATDWTSVPARVDGGRLIANLPDETMPDGLYDLRGHAVDRAGNETSTSTLADGTPMTVTLPLRSPTHLAGGRSQTRRRQGKRVRYLATRVRLGYAKRTRLQGRLSDASNKSMGSTALSISELLDVPGATWQPVRKLTTDANGRFRFRTAKRGASRTIRVRYDGTPTVRPSQTDVQLAVSVSSTLHASRHSVRSGHAVRFSGTLRGGHVPAGKLVQLQARVRGRWQTFANPHAKANGSWTYVYKFTGGTGRYVFRARIPFQAGYPFVTGKTATATIRVHRR